MNSISRPHVSTPGVPCLPDGGMTISAPYSEFPGVEASRMPSVDAHEKLDVQFSRTLCARMCHDLLGPAGAISIGLDFLDDAAATDAEALELVAASARQLKARLMYYRVAFGPRGGHGDVSVSEAQAIASSFFGGGRISLNWSVATCGQGDDAPSSSTDFIRLVLCLAMVAAETLPRGGELKINLDRMDGRSIARLTARGKGIRLSNETLRALQATDAEGLTARGFHVYYARHLAATLGAQIQLSQADDNELIFEAELADPKSSALSASQIC
jgi:histidine phosphotransferase ChpT